MRTTSLVIANLVLIVGVLTWSVARAEPQSSEPRPASPGTWRVRHVQLDDRPDFVQAIRGRALIHSIIYSSPGNIINVVAFVASADPRDADATVTEINAPTTSGTGQIELDVEVPDGLWLRGRGVVTVLYRPL